MMDETRFGTLRRIFAIVSREHGVAMNIIRYEETNGVSILK